MEEINHPYGDGWASFFRKHDMKFKMKAEVERVVIDDINLTIEAETEEEAYRLAELSLETFPDVHDIADISYCYIENREYVSNSVLNLGRVIDDEAA